MLLILLRLFVLFVSVALAAPTSAAPASQLKINTKYGTRGQKLQSHRGGFRQDGSSLGESGSDSSVPKRDSTPIQKVISRDVMDGRYIYEILNSCNTCECGLSCPRDIYFAVVKEYCVQCFDECKACSCNLGPDKTTHDFFLFRYVEPGCSSKCAKKCQAKPHCQNCSCDPNSPSLCMNSCRKCPAEGSKDVNQRCDLCPFRGCVDNACPCYGWCVDQICDISNPDGRKDVEQFVRGILLPAALIDSINIEYDHRV